MLQDERSLHGRIGDATLYQSNIHIKRNHPLNPIQIFQRAICELRIRKVTRCCQDRAQISRAFVVKTCFPVRWS